jgi:hypothetical protein
MKKTGECQTNFRRREVIIADFRLVRLLPRSRNFEKRYNYAARFAQKLNQKEISRAQNTKEHEKAR